MNKKPLIAGIVLIVCVLLVGGGIGAWKWLQIREAANQPAPPHLTSVEVVKAERMVHQPTARLVGTVVAKRAVSVANEVAGVVREVGFMTGDEVQEGQMLLQLDTATELADLAAAEAAQAVASRAVEVSEADVRVAQSNLELAESNQRRFETAGSAVSAADIDRVNADLRKARADIERSQSAVARAKAEVDQAAARVEQIRTVIAKKTLKAPFRALASIRNVHPGQYLAEGTQIVTLAEITEDIYLDFAVPQEYAARVVPGMVVVARSDVLSEESLQIKVLSMDAVVNPSTRNIRVRSSVADPEHRLRQGMFIDVEVPTDPAREYVTIPTTAVRRGAFGDHVYVVTPGTAEQQIPGFPPVSVANIRMVTLEADIGGRVLVSKGLEGGEEIAAGGSFKLMDKAMVVKGGAPGSGGSRGGPGGPPAAGAGEAASTSAAVK